MTETSVILERAKSASYEAPLSTEKKNSVLLNMADALISHTEDILAANETDLKNAKGKISEVMLDRLRLDEKRIESMAEGIREVVKLPDPVGRVLSETIRENGLKIRESLAKQNLLFRWFIMLALILMIVVFGMYGPEYSASAFIYERF